MAFNGTDLTVIASQAVGAGTVIYGVVKYLAKHFPKQVQAVESHVPEAVKTLAEDGVQLIKNLAESPLFAGKVEAGKLEAKHVIDQLNQTTAVSEAKTILLGVGKVYSALTPDEKVKAEVLLKLALSALGVRLNDAQIQSVFAEAQTAIDALKGQSFYKAAFEPQQSA